MQHDDQRQQQRGSYRPQQPLGPSVLPGDDQSQRSGRQERDRHIVIRVEEQRAADSDEDGSCCSARGDEQIEQRRFGRVRRPQRIRLRVTEQTGDEKFDEEETDAELDRPGRIGLREHPGQRGQSQGQQPHH